MIVYNMKVVDESTRTEQIEIVPSTCLMLVKQVY